MVGDCDGDRQLWLWGWVFPTVAFYLLLEGGPVDGSALLLVGGAGFIVQLEGLGNGCHRLLNSLSANAIFSSCVSISNPMGEGLDEGELFWLWEASQEGVGQAEVGHKAGPVGPELGPGFVSLSHDPMGCCSSRSSAKTNEQSFLLRVCLCHKAPWESGKEALNLVRKSVSLRL